MKPYDPKDNVADYTMDPERVVSALLLTEFTELEVDDLSSWTDDQRAIAFEWAMREHLHASDNDDVERFEMPSHVKDLIAVYCHACSVAGGADRAVYHCPPVCP